MTIERINRHGERKGPVPRWAGLYLRGEGANLLSSVSAAAGGAVSRSGVYHPEHGRKVGRDASVGLRAADAGGRVGGGCNASQWRNIAMDENQLDEARGNNEFAGRQSRFSISPPERELDGDGTYRRGAGRRDVCPCAGDGVWRCSTENVRICMDALGQSMGGIRAGGR